MRKILLFLFIGLSTTILSSCTIKIYTAEGNQEAKWKPHGPLFFIAPDGKYKGAIPCNNCPGIEVTLDFNTNNTIVKSMRYIQSSNKNTKDNGTWVVTPGNIVQVTYPNKATKEYYKAQNGGHLIMLNSKKELNINPAQAQFFIFNKD